MWKRILALALLCCALCGCMSAEERREARAIVRAQKKNFITQARVQYGEKVKVKDIKATADTVWNSLWPVIEGYLFTGELEGTVIQPDGVKFAAIYLPKSNVVWSTKNHDAIQESVRDFPGLDRFDYVEIQLKQIYHSTLSYLPDDVLTFADMLERQYYLHVFLFTTDDITGLTEEDFADLFRAWEQYESDYPGNLVLIQLEDPAVLTESRNFRHDLREISFQYPHEPSARTIYDYETKTDMDPFEKYGFAASLYMSCSWSSDSQKLYTDFVYNYKNYKYPPGVEPAAQDTQEEEPAPAGDEPTAQNAQEEEPAPAGGEPVPE